MRSYSISSMGQEWWLYCYRSIPRYRGSWTYDTRVLWHRGPFGSRREADAERRRQQDFDEEKRSEAR